MNENNRHKGNTDNTTIIEMNSCTTINSIGTTNSRSDSNSDSNNISSNSNALRSIGEEIMPTGDMSNSNDGNNDDMSCTRTAISTTPGAAVGAAMEMTKSSTLSDVTTSTIVTSNNTASKTTSNSSSNNSSNTSSLSSPKIQFTLSATKTKKRKGVGTIGTATANTTDNNAPTTTPTTNSATTTNSASNNNSVGSNGQHQGQNIKRKKTGFHNIFDSVDENELEQEHDDKQKMNGTASPADFDVSDGAGVDAGILQSKGNDNVTSVSASASASASDNSSINSGTSPSGSASVNASGNSNSNQNSLSLYPSISSGFSFSVSYSDSSSVGSCDDDDLNMTTTTTASTTTAASSATGSTAVTAGVTATSSTNTSTINNTTTEHKLSDHDAVISDNSSTNNNNNHHNQARHQLEPQTHSFTNHNDSNTTSLIQQQQRHHQLIQKSSSTWRVKLYRLNVDGSWDDCGTGRICLIRKNTSNANANVNVNANTTANTNSSTISGNCGNINNSNTSTSVTDVSTEKLNNGIHTTIEQESANPNLTLNLDLPVQQQQQQQEQQETTKEQQYQRIEEEIYHSLGEPTLFMHAEIPTSAVMATTTTLLHNDITTTTTTATSSIASSTSSSSNSNNSNDDDNTTAVAAPPTTTTTTQLENMENNSTNTATNKKTHVLLRTRVLLRDLYQRQGENIITWCEPFFAAASTSTSTTATTTETSTIQQQQQEQQHAHQQQGQGQGDVHSNNNDNSNNNNRENEDQQQQETEPEALIQQGVDLALSFQDNAGCLDIWNKISSIQLKAMELFEKQNNDSNIGCGTTSTTTAVVSSSMGEHVITSSSSATLGTETAIPTIPGDHNEQHQLHHSSRMNDDSNRDATSLTTDTSLELDDERTSIHMLHNTNVPSSSSSPSSPLDTNNLQMDTEMTSLSQQEEQQQQQQQENNYSNLSNWTTSNTRMSPNEVAGKVAQENENNGGGSSSGMGVMKYDIRVDENDHKQFIDADAEAAAVSMAAQYVGSGGHLNHNSNGSDSDNNSEDNSQHQSNQILRQLTELDCPNDGNMAANAQLPNPPKLGNLVEIADIIAAAQYQQREAISLFISSSDCAYLKALLALFPAAEKKDVYNILATLASIVKTILLLNDSGIIQLIASDGKLFESCCCCLEYDPDLRSKANHRWFLRDRLKFRTVVYMEDQELVETIHRSFRITYIRDTLLRPTMDESSLTTLSSLLTFTHADVVKGVMCAPDPSRSKSMRPSDNYLTQVLRLLGKEIRAIREVEWGCIDKTAKHDSMMVTHCDNPPVDVTYLSPSSSYESPDTPWKQYLAPQDNSVTSRKIRRRGCLSFLRELFNMVRISLQQSDKDDFYNLLVNLDVELDQNDKEEASRSPSNETVNLLSLLGAILSDINSDVSERGACLEILSVIAMFDASLIRKHSIEDRRSGATISRPHSDHKNNIMFFCPPNDLLLSLLFLMTVENDAGVMLQTSEVMRIILDTEMLNDASNYGGASNIDSEDEFPRGNGSFQYGSNTTYGDGDGGSEQNSFLQMFYDHYVPWFVAPFQYSIVVCRSAVPFSLSVKGFTKTSKDLLQEVLPSSLRLSFSVELLSFCVRAHRKRMGRYLLSTRVLINVTKLLNPRSNVHIANGDRCLKLAVLRCLRTILSLKDEFYNKHIVQNNLFAQVFDAFRANPVGDNLMSSAIIEMCDFIRTENIKPVIEHIVTKHFCRQPSSSTAMNDTTVKTSPSLEDFATPYVDTLTLLRHKYEENVSSDKAGASEGLLDSGDQKIMQSERAREDQRKFHEADEESYFFDEMEDTNESPHARPPSPAPLSAPSRSGLNI